MPASFKHHSLTHCADDDIRYILYHRRTLGKTDRDARVTAMDRLYFNAPEKIRPVIMTQERA